MANVLRLVLPETCLSVWVLMRHVLRTGARVCICFPSEHPASRLRGSIKFCKHSSEEQYVLPPCKGSASFRAHPDWFDFFHFDRLVLVIQVLPQKVAPDWDHFLCVVDLHGGIIGNCLTGQMSCWCEFGAKRRHEHEELEAPLEKHDGIVDQFKELCHFS
jgi:hypothetical protein